jgi:TRAP-type mannitol/chloroaromatic compound transport system permease small subunit
LGALARLADAIEVLIDRIGRAVSWLALTVVLLLFLQNPLRELRIGGQTLANDMGQLAHACVFIVGAAYAWRWRSLVRVDIFYQRMGPGAQALVNLIGTILLLLPWVAVVAWYSVPLALDAVRIREIFPDSSNPGHFLMKVLLLVFVFLLTLQASAVIARAIVVLRAPSAPPP